MGCISALLKVVFLVIMFPITVLAELLKKTK